MASIRIKVISNGQQPIVSILEGNLDFDEVSIERQVYEVKSNIPLEFLISAVSTFALQEFLLRPMADLIKEQWHKGIDRFLRSTQSCNLTFDITPENYIIEAFLGTSHNVTKDIWGIINQALDIIKQENLQQNITKVKIVVEGKNRVLVFLYLDKKPILMIDLKEKKSFPTPQDKLQFSGLEEANLSPIELFERRINKMADEYQEHTKLN